MYVGLADLQCGTDVDSTLRFRPRSIHRCSTIFIRLKLRSINDLTGSSAVCKPYAKPLHILHEMPLEQTT